MAFTIFKELSFAAAHHIPGHPGKCQRLHGHNYRIRLFLRAEQLDPLGMVIDFSDVKKVLHEVAGRFDHRVINELPPFDVKSPTAELLAEHVFEEARRHLETNTSVAGRVAIARVEVWENDTSCAIFEP